MIYYFFSKSYKNKINNKLNYLKEIANQYP